MRISDVLALLALLVIYGTAHYWQLLLYHLGLRAERPEQPDLWS